MNLPRAMALVCCATIVALSGCGHKAVVQSEPTRSETAKTEATPVERAVALYDDGRYDEARPLLEALVAAGNATGPLLYRLGFVVGDAGDEERRHQLMQEALVELEKEAATSDNLEVSFFLANSLNNVRRQADARTVAMNATARIESGQWPKATKPIDQFRLGKLYQDQGRAADAAAQYRAALAGWDSQGAKATGYRKWARRYLAEDSLGRADYRQAEADLTALTELGGASVADFDKLAVARVKVGKWSGAAEAWRESELLDPANADRPRYCRNLARLAEACDEVPSTTPSGAAWSSVTQQDLESLMGEQAKILRDARGEAAGGLSPERKSELALAVARARGTFAAAGLEYASRNLDIRQMAFTGGYAPLIFHPEEWTIEPPG